MRVLRSLLAVTILAGPAILAQPSGPAPEIASFDVLLGSWRGTGTAAMGASDGDSAWTALTTYSKILGGHFVQEDARFDIEGMAGPLVYRTVYSWDAQNRRIAFFSLGNSGELDQGHVYWIAGGKLVGASTSVEESEPATWRWIYACGTDGYEVRFDGARGGAPFARAVTGSFRRAETGFSAADPTVPHVIATPREEMKRIDALIGTWTTTGTFVAKPGMDRTPLTGTETVRNLFGGHAHFAETRGEAGAGGASWEGNFYMAWDPDAGTWRGFALNSAGGFHTRRTYAITDRRFVAIASGFLGGLPQTLRSVVDISADSNELRVVTHRCVGDQDPDESFEGTWTRVAATGSAEGR